MVASGISGKYFASGEQYTASKLHQVIESATVTGFDQTNMASGAGLVVVSTTAPADTDAIWYYSTLNLLLIYDSVTSSWQPIGGNYVRLTNKSGGAIVAGDVVVFDSANARSFTTTTTLNSVKVAGVASESIANNADGIIQVAGIADVNLTAATTPQNYIGTSTSAKAALANSSALHGKFGMTMETTLAAGLCKCLLWGQPAT